MSLPPKTPWFDCGKTLPAREGPFEVRYLHGLTCPAYTRPVRMPFRGGKWLHGNDWTPTHGDQWRGLTNPAA